MERYQGDGQCSEEYVLSLELANLYLASAHCIGWEAEKWRDLELNFGYRPSASPPPTALGYDAVRPENTISNNATKQRGCIPKNASKDVVKKP